MPRKSGRLNNLLVPVVSLCRTLDEPSLAGPKIAVGLLEIMKVLVKSSHSNEGAETHRALHRARQRMQRFSAMYTLSEGRQGRGENTLKWETFVHASSPVAPR